MANITSASITLRGTKGSPLTNTEVDNNFSNLNTALATGLTAASYTAADVLTKLNTVTGPTAVSALNADTVTFGTLAAAAKSTNTINSIVARDASGNFSAGTITANLTGTASIAASLNYTVAIAGGGTGGTTAAGARTNLGLVIGTDVQAYSATLGGLAAAGSAADTAPYYTGAGTASTYATTTFMRGLAGSAAAINARSTLGLTIGTDVQAYSANLAATSGISAGIIAMTAAGAASGRTITAGGGISVSNGNGVAGNPTISAAVTSVQGATGAVVVTVPVSSVQGATGDVTVTNIGGHAGASPHATNATNANNAGHAHSSANTGSSPHAHNSNNASHASAAPHAYQAHHAHHAQSGWPGHLSQFANDLGNYGNFMPNCRCNC